MEWANSHCVTSLVWNATAQRMLAMIYADMLATCADGKLGSLGWDEALAVTADGNLYPAQGGGAAWSEHDTPFSPGAVTLVGWWNPDNDDDYAPPSALAHTPATGRKADPRIECIPAGTVCGAGSGKLIPVGTASEQIAAVGARAQAKLSQAMVGVGGYRGWVLDKISRRIAGRAVGYALKTLLCNVLGHDRRNDPAHFISTRNWATGQTVGRKSGYAAYWRPRGRPALPYGEAKLREKIRQRARRKTNRNGKGRGGPKVYATKNPRPSGKEYKWVNTGKGKAVVLTAKRINEKRGSVAHDMIDKYLQKLMTKAPEKIAEELGKEAGQLLAHEVIVPFFKWVARGFEGAKERGRKDENTLNTPTVR